jgi:signal transduction histidine kinase
MKEDRTSLEIVGSSSYTQEELDALGEWRQFPLEAPVPLAEAARTRHPLWIESPEAWIARYPHLAAELEKIDHRAWAMLPLMFEGQVLGTLGLAFADSQHFTQAEQAYLLTLGQQCEQAIQRTRLFDQAKDALVEAEKAISLRDVFLSIAAHELRTPLTTMVGNIQMIQRRFANKGDTLIYEQRLLNIANQQMKRLSRMIEELLDASRLAKGQFALTYEPFDFSMLVTRVVDEMQPQLHQHNVEAVLPEESIIINGDISRLEQVLQNLLQNAVKYSPQGGVIMVHVSLSQNEQSKPLCCVAVSDQGVGIPQAAMPNLFSRFFRAANVKEGFGGLGVWLYIVKEIISLHGGTISIESTEGHGSTFTFCIPVEVIR